MLDYTFLITNFYWLKHCFYSRTCLDSQSELILSTIKKKLALSKNWSIHPFLNSLLGSYGCWSPSQFQSGKASVHPKTFASPLQGNLRVLLFINASNMYCNGFLILVKHEPTKCKECPRWYKKHICKFLSLNNEK